MKNCIQKIMCGELVVIGVRDYTECLEPLSDLFINDIEGIGLKVAAAVVKPDYETGAKLLKEKGILAVKYAMNDFKTMISPTYNLNAIIENANKCEFSKGSSFFWPNTPLNRGIKITRVNEPLAKIHIKRLFIRANQAASVILKIEDKNDVHEHNVDLVQGLTIVEVEQTYQDDEVFVTIDNTNIGMAMGFCFNTCIGCGNGSIKDIVIEGWNGSSADNNLYGINAEVILKCDIEDLFCAALNQLYFTIYYKHAELVFREMASTNRLNNIAHLSKEQAAEKVEEYEKKYKKEYKSTAKSLNKLLKSYRGYCVTCKGNTYVTMLP